MRKAYRSRALVAQLAFFVVALFSCATLIYADWRHGGGRYVALLVAALALYLILFALYLIVRRDTLFLMIETDGESWIRGFTERTDVLLTAETVNDVRFDGFAMIISAPAGRGLRITQDHSGYNVVRSLVEKWRRDNASG